MQDLFAERLVNVSLSQGVVRLDFARLESVDPEKKQATFAPSVRLVMPIDSFMQAAEQISRVREDVIKQSQAQAANQPAA
jgi:hypothetical protein